MITADLCGVCAAKYRDGGMTVRHAAGGKDCKVTCSVCGKRRYGATFTIEKKGEKAHATEVR